MRPREAELFQEFRSAGDASFFKVVLNRLFTEPDSEARTWSLIAGLSTPATFVFRPVPGVQAITISWPERISPK